MRAAPVGRLEEVFMPLVRTGTEPRNVFVTLTENEPIDWSLGDGEAQYAPGSAGYI
ncbi:hypothetical protein SGLAM104S_09366 [Streptomyces glaucescens]|jgi:hypothetical protein